MLPPGIRTRSLRNAKIAPVCNVSDEVVSKTCSPTSDRLGLRQRWLRVFVLLAVAVGPVLGDLQGQSLGRLIFDRGPDEAGEKRMRTGRAALEFGVRLRADHERVHLRRVLDELDQVPVWRGPGEFQAALGDAIAVSIVDLVAVPVPLGHL